MLADLGPTFFRSPFQTFLHSRTHELLTLRQVFRKSGHLILKFEYVIMGMCVHIGDFVTESNRFSSREEAK